MPARILVSRCCFWCCLPLVRRPSRDIQIARFNFRFLSAPPPRLFCGLVIRHRDYTNSTLRRARFQLPPSPSPSLPPRLSLPLPPLSIGVPDGGGGGAILTRINDHANERMRADRSSPFNYRYHARFTVTLHCAAEGGATQKKPPLQCGRVAACRMPRACTRGRTVISS